MDNKIKFHLDENVSNSIALGLRHRGIDVTTTPEENLLGVSDERQLQFASSNGRVIFTQDTDFLKRIRPKITFKVEDFKGIRDAHKFVREELELLKFYYRKIN